MPPRPSKRTMRYGACSFASRAARTVSPSAAGSAGTAVPHRAQKRASWTSVDWQAWQRRRGAAIVPPASSPSFSRQAGHRPPERSASMAAPQVGQVFRSIGSPPASLSRIAGRRLHGVARGAKGLEEISDLVLHVLVRADGVRYAAAQLLAVAPAQAMDGDLDGTRARDQLAGRICMRPRALSGGHGL